MTYLLLILLLVVGCSPTDSGDDGDGDPTYSPLGVWFGDNESFEICDYVDGECIKTSIVKNGTYYDVEGQKHIPRQS